MQNILVVDDDPTVAEVVTGYLERAGYAVARAADGPGALEAAGERWPDLVVLDLMLPGMDGLEVCRRLRGRGPVPVIMLTARGDEDDRILGLETGADDYVTKPFSPRELVLRVESVLRRGRAAADGAAVGPVLSCAGITVDPSARRVVKDGAEVGLTLREFDLLLHLMRHRGLAIGRERLMREVWGWDFGDLSTVTVHVRRLRGKIEDDPARPRLIHTVWGVGYRFDAPGEPEGRAPGGGRLEAGRWEAGRPEELKLEDRTPGNLKRGDLRSEDSKAGDPKAGDRTPGDRTPGELTPEGRSGGRVPGGNAAGEGADPADRG
ncbi:DNA-binding response regulator [Streptomyces tirandamycinicus]|uniref:DNA-binding response regulator n=1 Tax=Streptomyces tirandamycinicus TaxID=2174846 RepID=A0A2S1SYY4_9ACTN|nr:response regulator transcription factor [Streptomyces tirandamycinicus]AWI31643.1 DNA-binding response regulator [Streptomyces tirandamycinicus]